MAAASRFGLRTSSANAGKPASGWCQKAKTLAKICTVRSDQIQPNHRINSCGIASRVETIISQRFCVNLLTPIGSSQYHYCSINTERRNSENSCTNCGNPNPSICTDLHILLKYKHLDLSQNGPRLAKYVSPA
jgi:hypothetical protein